MKRRVAVLAELGPGRCPACDWIGIVGITSDGAVPLVLEKAVGRPATIRLPEISHPDPFDPLAGVHDRLRLEAGLGVDEVFVMSRYGIPTGDRGHATLVLAPRVRVVERPGAVPFSVVPLPEVLGWLERRKREGAHIDATVRVGLMLAERRFPGWARARLCGALEALRRRPDASDSDRWNVS